MKKVIVRLKGGLGNQLFSYSAARRLAYMNDAELVLDSRTGFFDDHRFKSQYFLDRFHVSARLAAPHERLEPFARYRRRAMKWISSWKPFERRAFLVEEAQTFDHRLLEFGFDGTLYLEGYWQSERYFRDVASLIRHDLRIIPPGDGRNQELARHIQRGESVGIHVRWFDAPGSSTISNLSSEYYSRAIQHLSDRVEGTHFYLFSDVPEEARKALPLSNDELTVVDHNHGRESAFADLWLMTQCRHFVCANSTFSWWGAWLAQNPAKVVIAPDASLPGVTWTFPAEIPNEWTKL